MSKHKRFALIALITVFILSACGTAAEETSPPETVPVDLPPIVSATGEVVPAQEALLSVTVGGVVQDVLVEKGEPISSKKPPSQLLSWNWRMRSLPSSPSTRTRICWPRRH
jgi:hypothetical protein